MCLQVENIPVEIQVQVKSKKFTDARQLEREKHIKELKAKLLHAMPMVPLKVYPRNDNMELRHRTLPPLFNKIYTYDEHNRKNKKDQDQVVQNLLNENVIEEIDQL